jgi:spoIIIJ-associated protein
MEAVVRTARTVEEAEELALKELGIDRNEAEVEILSRGKAGFLGIGAEMARVRVTRLSQQGASPAAGPAASTTPGVTATPSPRARSAPANNAPVATAEEGSAAALALEAVDRVLSLAGVNVVSTLRSANDPDVGGPIIDLTGEDSGLLIGRRGQTLQALQFVVNMIARKELGESVRVVLDVEHYRQRREESLRDMASKVASRVAQTGRSITLEPMSAADRRMVHVALAEYQGVRTESVGMGDDRKVTIFPTSQANS